jgi:hypothetical protein
VALTRLIFEIVLVLICAFPDAPARRAVAVAKKEGLAGAGGGLSMPFPWPETPKPPKRTDSSTRES